VFTEQAEQRRLDAREQLGLLRRTAVVDHAGAERGLMHRIAEHGTAAPAEAHDAHAAVGRWYLYRVVADGIETRVDFVARQRRKHLTHVRGRNRVGMAALR